MTTSGTQTNQDTRAPMRSQLFTVQPSGVVLVGPHGRLLPQSSEDGRVRPHEVDVDAGVQLSICMGTKERRKAVISTAPRPARRLQVELKQRVWTASPQSAAAPVAPVAPAAAAKTKPIYKPEALIRLSPNVMFGFRKLAS